MLSEPCYPKAREGEKTMFDRNKPIRWIGGMPVG